MKPYVLGRHEASLSEGNLANMLRGNARIANGVHPYRVQRVASEKDLHVYKNGVRNRTER
jgi:hypothetical protein